MAKRAGATTPKEKDSLKGLGNFFAKQGQKAAAKGAAKAARISAGKSAGY